MRLLSTVLRQRANWRAPAHLALLTVTLQGAPIISQAVASLIVPLAVIGSIRTMESALPIMVLLGSLGASSLAVREIAAAPNDASRREMGRDLLLLPFTGTLALLAIGSILLLLAPSAWAPWIRSALPILPLALLININRCLGGTAQGWNRVAEISVPVAIGSALAVLCHLAGVWFGEARGWMIGRYAGEILVLACFASVLRPGNGGALRAPIHWPRFGRLAAGAIVLNLAFVFRASADALPLLALATAGQTGAEVGAFGIATLVLTMVMLPIAVLSQFTLPALTKAAASGQASRRTAILMLTALGGLATIAIGGTALLFAELLPPTFQPVARFVALLSLALPLKAAATGYGTRLIAAARFEAPLLGNGLELAAIFLFCAIEPTPIRCGIAVILGAAVSLGSLAWLDHRPMRRH